MEERYSHAGGVVVRRHDDDVQIMLVTAKNRPDHWVLPKGHIDDGETPESAAVREVEEECGVVGKILAKAGDSSFETKGEKVTVAFYVIEYRSSVPTDEGRQLRWCGPDEAVELVSFEDSRNIL